MAASFRRLASFLLCILLVAQAYCGLLRPERKENDGLASKNEDPSGGHGVARDGAIAKRSADWSTKISAADQQQDKHAVQQQPQTMVRRIRIHNGAQKIIRGGEVEEVSLPPGSADIGVKKVVRVKKLRRKPKRKMTTATAAPEVVTALDPYLSSPVPKISTQPGFAHITVVNKEGPKSPKANPRRKKKQRPIAAAYDSEAKQNAVAFATAFPQHPEVLLFSPQYPDFGGYFADGPGNQKFVVHQHRTSPADLQQQFGHAVAWTSRPEGGLLQHQDSLDLRDQFPSYYRGPFFAGVETKPLLAPPRGRKATPARMTRVQPAPETGGDSKAKSDEASNKSETDAVERSGNAATTPPPPPKENPALQNVTKADEVVDKLIEVVPPIATNNRGGRPLQNRHLPLHRAPQNAYFDPFFNTPAMMPAPVNGRPTFGVQRQMFSPFYSPGGGDDSSEEYLFAPFQPGGGHLLLSGFRPSPQLSSLRRSILDEQADSDEGEAAVTPFSLPKFEMPAIDFNDKGCRTLYKEVKTAPGDDKKKKKGSEESAKSFIISRECYFPDGIPTARQHEGKDDQATKAPEVEVAMAATEKDSSTGNPK